jgi:hypothetical protein
MAPEDDTAALKAENAQQRYQLDLALVQLPPDVLEAGGAASGCP